MFIANASALNFVSVWDSVATSLMPTTLSLHCWFVIARCGENDPGLTLLCCSATKYLRSDTLRPQRFSLLPLPLIVSGDKGLNGCGRSRQQTFCRCKAH